MVNQKIANKVILFSGSLLLLVFVHISNSIAAWKLIGPGDADQITSLSILNGIVYAGTDVGGIYRSYDQGATWSPANNSLNNLDITTPVFQDVKNNEVLYVGTRGGFYKSIDGGDTWKNKRKGLPGKGRFFLSGSIGGLAVNPFDCKELYIGLGYRPSYVGGTTVRRLRWSKYIYKSQDQGESWSKIQAFEKAAKVFQVLHSPSYGNIVYAATSDGLYRSNNNGNEWKKIFERPTYNILLCPEDKSVILVSCGAEGVYRSMDMGKSWVRKNYGLPTINFNRRFSNRYSVFAINPIDNNVIYLANSSWGRSGGLYKSTNMGESWELITEDLPESWLKTSRRMNAVAVHPDNPKMIFLGSSRYLYRSQNSGKSWQQLISKHSANAWTHTGINVFGHTRDVLVDPDHPHTIFVGTSDHKMVRSNDNGISWQQLMKTSKHSSYILGIAKCRDGTGELMALTSGNDRDLCIMKSKDQGENWSENCGDIGRSNGYNNFAVNVDTCDDIYITVDHGLIKSTDRGASWSNAANGLPGIKMLSVAIDPANSKVIYGGAAQGLFKSIDAGINWTKIHAARNRPVTSILISKSDSNMILIGTDSTRKSASCIYRTVDGGISWAPVYSNVEKYVSDFTQLNSCPSIVYASTLDHNYHDESKGSGVLRSLDHGKTWQRVDENLPVHRAYNIESFPNKPCMVYLSTAGSGVYQREDEICSKQVNKPKSVKN